MAENSIFFIINKHAGTSFQSSVEGRIIDACRRLDLECTIGYTNHKGHATELARQAVTEGYPRVFALGGDGTVNEVARGLVHTTVAMGIIPKGSGNGLARHLQIPLNVRGALDLLDRHQVIPMDTLSVNGQLSVNVSGIGFDAQVATRFGKNGKRGLFGYAKLALQEYRKFSEFDVQATVGEKSWSQKSFIIAVANSSQFGNNARVAPLASVCDGEMDVCFIRKVPLSNSIDVTIRMFTGSTQHSRWVEVHKGRQFRAECTEPIPYHIDGEARPAEKIFNVEMQPGSLKMIVPVTAEKL